MLSSELTQMVAHKITAVTFFFAIYFSLYWCGGVFTRLTENATRLPPKTGIRLYFFYLSKINFNGGRPAENTDRNTQFVFFQIDFFD